MSQIDFGFLTNNKSVSFPKITTAPKFEQGKTKQKKRHNEFLKTLFIKIDFDSGNLSGFDETSLITLPPILKKVFTDNDNQPYLQNTYTNSSFIESVLMCFDNELSMVNTENERKFIIDKYLSVLDSDLKLHNFWTDNPENKSEFKRQLYGINNNADVLGKMISDSLNLNIILVDSELNKTDFIGECCFKDENPIILVVKKFGRYFPLISNEGSVFNIKENEIISLFEEIKLIEKIIPSSESNS